MEITKKIHKHISDINIEIIDINEINITSNQNKFPWICLDRDKYKYKGVFTHLITKMTLLKLYHIC